MKILLSLIILLLVISCSLLIQINTTSIIQTPTIDIEHLVNEMASATISALPSDAIQRGIETNLAKYSTLTATLTNTTQVTNTSYPTETVTPQEKKNTIVPTKTPKKKNKCDPAYPDVCIPSPPPDLNCDDITYRNFKVLSPDPHKFDRDHNGIGCE